jgi:hypothetical protein
VKEASGNLEQIARICRDRPSDVAVLAGDDAWTLPILALGGDGVISVASNEIPGEMVALCAAARSGDWEAARRIHDRWLPLLLGNFRADRTPSRSRLPRGDAVRARSCRSNRPRGRHGLLRQLGVVEGTGGRTRPRSGMHERNRGTAEGLARGRSQSIRDHPR